MEDFLIGQDIYGYAIGVNYQGKGVYQTRLGAMCTFISYVLMIVITLNLSIAFSDGSKQEEKVQTTQFDIWNTEKYYLTNNGLSVNYLIWPPLGPEIG